ncbi:MAG: chromosome segregation protein SMC [Paracoccaceae bacterium]
MKLLALHLTNVRKFTGKRASITGIGDGITVVSEANEFGKSTFFDAIHALFFEKYSATSKPVKSLQPYAGGGVEVAADIATDQGSFRLEKRFLARKSAKVIRLNDNVTIAQDDEAERWIATLLGSGSEGPAGLLWVRQGLLGLEPEGKTEKTQAMDARRDILSSVAGEIDAMTGGRRMDRVMRAVADALAALATKTGRKTGVWKQAADEVEALEADLATVSAQVATLDTALIARKAAEAAFQRLNNADANSRRDAALKAAKAAMDTARAHAGLVTAGRQDRDLAALKAKAAQADLDAFLAALDGLSTAQALVIRCTAQSDEAKAEAAQLKQVLDVAQVKYRDTLAAVTQTRADLDAARLQIAARKARSQAQALASQITKAEAAAAERDAARAVVKASTATADWLQRIEAATADVAKHTATLTATATTLRVTYDGSARIALNGEDVPQDKALRVEGEARLTLPGIGQMVLTAQAAGVESQALLVIAKARLTDLLAQTGATTVQDARERAATRAQAQIKADRAQDVLDALAPDGTDALHGAKAEADLTSVGAHDAPLPAIAALETALAEAEQTEKSSHSTMAQTDRDHTTARETAIKAEAAAEAAQATHVRAATAAGPAENHDSRRADLLRDHALSDSALKAANTSLQSLIDAAPDQDTASAELQRAEAAVTAAQTERSQLGERLAALSSEIRTLAGNGIEERRDDLAGQLYTARMAEARLAQQAAALTRLQAALEAERNAARDMYFGPVQEELKPLLSILHRDATLHFDSDSLLPTGLTRADADEMLDDLSGGTREQIAILTRLAFARLFARQGRHMPIILDDALVYSDDDRIIKMFTALTRVAKDQQIIVFSCRQLAFQDLGGARPVFEVVSV